MLLFVSNHQPEVSSIRTYSPRLILSSSSVQRDTFDADTSSHDLKSEDFAYVPGMTTIFTITKTAPGSTVTITVTSTSQIEPTQTPVEKRDVFSADTSSKTYTSGDLDYVPGFAGPTTTTITVTTTSDGVVATVTKIATITGGVM
jgi:hypothetical protein